MCLNDWNTCMCIVMHIICDTTKHVYACMLIKPCYIDNTSILGVFDWMNHKLHVVNQLPSILFRSAVLIFNFQSTVETMMVFSLFLTSCWYKMQLLSSGDYETSWYQWRIMIEVIIKKSIFSSTYDCWYNDDNMV